MPPHEASQPSLPRVSGRPDDGDVSVVQLVDAVGGEAVEPVLLGAVVEGVAVSVERGQDRPLVLQDAQPLLDVAHADWPPPTLISVPFTYAAASEASIATTTATSSGRPKRPSGVPEKPWSIAEARSDGQVASRSSSFGASSAPG